MVLEMTKDVLTRIQLRCISGKVFQLDTTVLTFHKQLHHRAAMSRQSIPNNQQGAGNVPQQVSQKLDHLGSLDGSVEQAKVKVVPTDSGGHRQGLPVEMVLQHRRFSFRGPRPAAVRPLTQSAFVDEDDRATFDFGVFFSSGHRTRFQRRMAFSSRSKAFPVGLWQLQPRSRKIRHACTLVYRTPHSCWIRSATRWLVHNPASYPNASGPRCSPSSMRLRSSSLSLGLRPARPAFFSAANPPFCFALVHRTTDCRCTPRRRATSDWFTPCSNNLAAFMRRRCNSSKFRFMPAGFPMPVTLAEFHLKVYLYYVIINKVSTFSLGILTIPTSTPWWLPVKKVH
jgi:hypothetical protein